MARCLCRRAVRLAFAACAVVLTASAGSALAQPEPRFELSQPSRSFAYSQRRSGIDRLVRFHSMPSMLITLGIRRRRYSAVKIAVL